MDKLQSLPLSKIHSPAQDALADIEQTTLALSSRYPVCEWLDPDDVDWFMRCNPVIVIQVSRHYEVVAGFRAYHAVKSILEPGQNMAVCLQRNTREVDLIKCAFYQLVSDVLMHTPKLNQTSAEAYRLLTKLSLRLRQQHGLKLPKKFSARSLKALFDVESKEMRSSRKRQSQLTRLMED